MNKITTESGFTCSINSDSFDDWEMLEAFRAIDRGEVDRIVDVAPIMLGDKQYNALKEHVRNKNGKVKSSLMIKEITEIMNKAGETKNS